MRRRGTGWRADPIDSRDYVAASRFGFGDVEPPDEASLEHHVGEIYDQGQTNSCVGWAFSNAIGVAESVAGLDPVPPSALMAYTLARFAANPTARVVLDVGCRPRDLIRVLSVTGVCDQQYWPFKDLWWRKNVRPSMNAIIMAAGRAGGEYARIGGYGASKLVGIRQAIAAGYPVISAYRITDHWYDYAGGTLEMPDLTYPIDGGHMVCLVGYEPGRFRFVNSWGYGWGDDGMGWVSEAYVGSGYCSDNYTIRGWKRIREAYAKRAEASVA